MKLNLPGVSGLYVWLAISFGLFGAQAAEVPLSNEVAVAMQWRAAVAPGAEHYTLELYLANTGTNRLEFETLAFNGQSATNTDVITWWQYYPDGVLNPKQTRVCRINFRKSPARGQKAQLGVRGGGKIEATILPWRIPARDITAITYALDYSRMYVQFRAGGLKPVKVWINGHEIGDFRLLEPANKEDHGAVALTPPEPLTNGTPVHVRLLFQDGSRRDALVRALSGITLDAYLVKPEERGRLGLDTNPPVETVKAAWGGDVACFDTKAKRQGSAAEVLITERRKTLADEPGKLVGLHYCTGAYAQMWDLYGPLLDTAYVNPYCLSHGNVVSRWLDDEIAYMGMGRRSVSPCGWGWIPDVFKRKARFTEAVELEILSWSALARGCKGIKYFAYDFEKDKGFNACPALLGAITNLNSLIHRQAAQLSPLMPGTEEVIGGKTGGLEVVTAWAGERGLLVVVRNLSYTTDAQANDGGAKPRFQAIQKQSLTVPIAAPAWLGDGPTVTDFFSGARVPSTRRERALDLTLAKLGSHKVLWINAGMVPAKPARWYEFWKLWRRDR